MLSGLCSAKGSCPPLLCSLGLGVGPCVDVVSPVSVGAGVATVVVLAGSDSEGVGESGMGEGGVGVMACANHLDSVTGVDVGVLWVVVLVDRDAVSALRAFRLSDAAFPLITSLTVVGWASGITSSVGCVLGVELGTAV